MIMKLRKENFVENSKKRGLDEEKKDFIDQ
jgi:hypothetical protein